MAVCCEMIVVFEKLLCLIKSIWHFLYFKPQDEITLFLCIFFSWEIRLLNKYMSTTRYFLFFFFAFESLNGRQWFLCRYDSRLYPSKPSSIFITSLLLRGTCTLAASIKKVHTTRTRKSTRGLMLQVLPAMPSTNFFNVQRHVKLV